MRRLICDDFLRRSDEQPEIARGLSYVCVVGLTPYHPLMGHRECDTSASLEASRLAVSLDALDGMAHRNKNAAQLERDSLWFSGDLQSLSLQIYSNEPQRFQVETFWNVFWLAQPEWLQLTRFPAIAQITRLNNRTRSARDASYVQMHVPKSLTGFRPETGLTTIGVAILIDIRK